MGDGRGLGCGRRAACLLGMPCAWGPARPLPDTPYPTGRALSASTGVSGLLLPGACTHGASSASRGHTKARVLFSALKCPPPLPVCDVPLVPGAHRRGGRATPSVGFLQPFLLGQGRCGTLETITRNFVYTKYHLSLLCALASSLLQKVVQRGPAAALTSVQT